MGASRFPLTEGVCPVPVTDVANCDTRVLNPLNILLLARTKRINGKQKRSIQKC